MFCNYELSKPIVSSHVGLIETLYKFTAFRYLPHILKQHFWFYSAEFDQYKTMSSDGNAEIYPADNIWLYKLLKDKGISIDNAGKSYKVIHTDGAHPPYTLDENLEISEETATGVTETKASLRIVYEYIRQLKELEVYDNTLLFITADHGERFSVPTSPFFLVKPFNSRGGITNTNAPICNGDILATVMDTLGLYEDEKYGRSIFQIPENDQRIRQYFYYTWDDTWDANYLPRMTEYYVMPEGNNWDCFVPVTMNPPDYILGTRLTFAGEETTARQYSMMGLSINEETHTWSRKSKAILSFHLDHIPEKDVLVHFDVMGTYNGSQRVIASVHSQIVFQEAVTGARALDFIIPKNLVDNEILTIELKFPDAVSPYSLGQGDDRDLLALCLTGMYLEETDLSESSLNRQEPIRDYRQEIVFTPESDGRTFFASGISEIEEDFAWSLGKSSKLCLPIGETNYPLTTTFNFGTVFNNSQRILVRCGEKLLYDGTVAMDNLSVIFNIPPECIVNGNLVLEIDYPNAVSPKELSISDDERVLAVAYRSINIESMSDENEMDT